MSQSTRPYEKEDVFRMKWLHSAEMSPDGSQVVYALSEYDAEDDKDYTNLWLKSLTDDSQRQLTFGKQTNASAAWAPDGSSIAFVSNRSGGKPQVFLISAEFGDARQLTSLEQGVGGAPIWSPDGSAIAITAGRVTQESDGPEKPYRLTRNVHRFDGVGYVHRALNDIYVVQVGDGSMKQLTDNDGVNSNLVWSSDGTQLLYLQSLQADNFASVFPSIALVDLDGNDRILVSSADYGLRSAAVFVDGDSIAFAGVERSRPIAQQVRSVCPASRWLARQPYTRLAHGCVWWPFGRHAGQNQPLAA